MAQNLFSLRNELQTLETDTTYLELNPAVVETESGTKFALSAVCVGPELAADEYVLSLEVSCDGQRALLETVHQQSETTDEDHCLTVALFSVTRSFIEILATARDVEISLAGPGSRLDRSLDDENRGNLARFLDLAGPPAALGDAPPRALAGAFA